ncbi:MAG TPA: Flp family type IVb pilin [Desulfobacteria bacterium]|nr:Flp family type IVb pilin [Desulfobacteria bacterium]
MMQLIKRLWKEEEGQGLVEYALILALIAIIVIGAVKAVGNKADATFDKIEASL